VKYLLFISLLVFDVFSQILAPPYRLENQLVLDEDAAYQIRRADGKSFIIHYRNKHNDIPSRFRISDANFGVIDAFNFKNAEVVIRSVRVIDIDYDDEDEIFFFLKEKDIAKLVLLYPFKDSLKVLHQFEYADNYFSGNLFVASPKNHDSFFVSIAENHPSIKSFRGIISFSKKDFTINWVLPFADYLYTFDYSESRAELLLGSIAYNNKFEYKDEVNQFYVDGKPGLIIKNAFPKIKISDSFYSSDSISSLKRISFDGKLLKNHIMGHSFVSSYILQRSEDYLLLIVHPRTAGSDKEITINKYYYDYDKFENILGINTSNHQSFRVRTQKDKMLFNDGTPIIYKIDDVGNLDKYIDLSDRLNPNRLYSINVDDKFIYLDEQQNTHIIDEEGSIIASIPKPHYIYYYESLGLIHQVKQGKLYFDKLIKLNLLERITPDTYVYLTGFLGSSTIIVLFFWLLTMSISKKRILKQKLEIEESHKELTHTTLKLIESEKLAVLGTIASSVAHELNSPLGAILNSAERIEGLENADQDIRKNSSLIKKAAVRSKTIIEKFLLASRTSTGNEITNVANVINDWKELFEKQFLLSGIKISYKVDESLSVRMPYEELNQVIINLMFNSKDSLAETSNQEKIIKILLYKENDKAILEIEDNGAGFDKDILNKAFNAFITTKEAGKGTGLGLWICKRLITEAGGIIEISNIDKGAIVRIILDKYDG
jgi:signal transduction histidine kinase